ncbi:hypothetical protein JXA32_08425 [Candidatus Sumerlaeota bacterium]|nr:hypothetical protein [Candidatus Sumerlaeota bacterium]
MRIVIAGPKGAGKSTIGALLADQLAMQAVETDAWIERLHAERRGERFSCRQIYNTHGAEYFRALEAEVVQLCADLEDSVIITGGSTLLNPDSLQTLVRNSVLVLLTGNTDVLWTRIARRGLPQWLQGENGRETYDQQVREREAIIRPHAQIVLDSTDDSPNDLAQHARDEIFSLLDKTGEKT